VDKPATTRRLWSTRKKDKAPRGIYRHPSGVWAIRYACGLGDIHKERVGPLKSDAVRAYHDRRTCALSKPGWCPLKERRDERERVRQSDEAQRQATARAITVKDYAERWLKVHVAPSCRERTALQYQQTLKDHVYPALGHVPLGELRRAQVKEFFADKAAQGLSRGTLKNIAIPLSAMLNAAVEEERIPGNPAARLWRRQRGRTEDEARKVKVLSASELAQALQTADEHSPEHSDIIFTLAWTGLRLSEACGLQWRDIDLNGYFLEVNRTVAHRGHRILAGAPKSGRARRVDLPAALVARLRARQSVAEAEAALKGHDLAPWVFPAPSDDSKPMNAAFLRFKVWYRLLRRVGLRGVRLHDLRHTYASLLLQAGEPMLYVKEQLGHSSIQVTVDLYGHIKPGMNREAVDRLAQATSRPEQALNFPATSSEQLPEHEAVGEIL